MSDTRIRNALALTALALASFSAPAELYRIVGPNGRVTFSDRPPPDAPAAGSSAAAMGARGAASAPTAGSLPYELRAVASRYPVTIYTGNACDPCSAGRAFLSTRGVPFTEKTVNTNDDIQALQRLTGNASLPTLTIGGQQLKGFSDSEWSQFLDAAGYPKTSLLPASYRNPPAAPLVVVQKAPTPAEPTGGTSGDAAPGPNASPAAPALPTPGTPQPGNPAGIRF